MNYYFQQRAVNTCCLMLALCLIAAPALAAKKGNRANDAARHSQNAAQVLNEIMGAPDRGIPEELVDKAQAIAFSRRSHFKTLDFRKRSPKG